MKGCVEIIIKARFLLYVAIVLIVTVFGHKCTAEDVQSRRS